MKVAKLSTGKLVRYLAGPQTVSFADGEFTLVSAILSMNPNRCHPFWVPSTQVVWVLEFE